MVRNTPNRATLNAETDLAFVTIESVDEQDAVVRHASHTINVEVSGAGQLLAIGSTNPLSEALYTDARQAAHEGRLMAIVRSAGQAGAITLRASSEGLAGDEVHLRASNLRVS